MLAAQNKRLRGVSPAGSLKKKWRFHMRGLFGGVLLAPVLLIVLFSEPHFVEGTVADIDRFWRLVLLHYWSDLSILGDDLVGGRKRYTLVCEGPYSICRNPLYVGSLLLTLSAGLYLDSLAFMIVVGLKLMIAYVKVTVPAEEEFAGNSWPILRGLLRAGTVSGRAFRCRSPPSFQ
jgi:protein-S-isoprenylcysteine O-methyltransferase Ste14